MYPGQRIRVNTERSPILATPSAAPRGRRRRRRPRMRRRRVGLWPPGGMSLPSSARHPPATLARQPDGAGGLERKHFERSSYVPWGSGSVACAFDERIERRGECISRSSDEPDVPPASRPDCTFAAKACTNAAAPAQPAWEPSPRSPRGDARTADPQAPRPIDVRSNSSISNRLGKARLDIARDVPIVQRRIVRPDTGHSPMALSQRMVPPTLHNANRLARWRPQGGRPSLGGPSRREEWRLRSMSRWADRRDGSTPRKSRRRAIFPRWPAESAQSSWILGGRGGLERG